MAFEGGDGAGKSTQVGLLAEALRAAGREVVVTRQPGGTRLGETLREWVLHGGHLGDRTETLLFAADKAEHVEQVVRPALAAGRDVVTDRYADSSIAYQGAGRGLGVEEVRRIQHWAIDGVLPDLTVVLDVAPQVGRRRRGSAEPDRMEAEGDGFHDRVRRYFLDRAVEEPSRYLVLDATASPSEVHAAVLERLALPQVSRR